MTQPDEPLRVMTPEEWEQWRRNDAAIKASCKLLGVGRTELPSAVYKLATAVDTARRELAELEARQ